MKGVATSGGGASSTNKTQKGGTSVPTITHFGLQSNSDNTLFATWSWSKDNTDNYETEWYYDTGDGVWFVGNKSTTEDKQSTYNIPSNAKRVKFRVKPISKTYTSNDKETSYWTAGWSTEKIYKVSDSPPGTPSIPKVTIENCVLTAEVDNLDINATKIEFQIVVNNTGIYGKIVSTITTGHASCSRSVTAGCEYKVRCRGLRGSEYGDWSEYSDNVSTEPATPTITSIKASSETSVYIEWKTSYLKYSDVPCVATSYDIEYSTKKDYFDGSDKTTTVSGVKFTHYEKTGLESGTEYFFRVRGVNDQGSSSWSEIKSVIIGKKPSPPTTWSSATTVVTGEPLTLYWVHNSEDGSSQTYASLHLYINGVLESYTIENTASDEDNDKISSYVIDTSQYPEGTSIQWSVRTAGITKIYSEASILRTVKIYAKPTLDLSVTDADGETIETLTIFPFYVSAIPGPNTQKPIGYHLTIVSNDIYETFDDLGNSKTVNKGEEVYSKYFDISKELLVEFSPSNVNLENNITYTITCSASMNSGLTVEESVEFIVSWTDVQYEPNAEISIDYDTLVAYIRPYCEYQQTVFYKVEQDSDIYTKTDEVVEISEGIIVESSDGNVSTTTGEIVCHGTTTDDLEVYYCTVEESGLIEDVTLSVYRREFDGSYTELATGLSNTRRTFITDPHPALDYARYRIVAVTNSTGAIGYYDVPGYPVGEKAIIIQWDDDWTNFDTTNEDALEQPPWSGSLLKLPYNIDLSDSHSSDVSLVEYAGRKHPVSYYGTQLGESATWSVEIPSYDKETLYALRRLAIWMGDVYVREPSGSGYWATISVSFSQTHCKVTIPVTLDITRVEGGV